MIITLKDIFFLITVNTLSFRNNNIQLRSSMYFCWDLFIKFISLLFIYLFKFN